jgi:hypothetical protein
MQRIIFFRNDDVRQSLDESLISITGLFISKKIPITLAVEPANISNDVNNWLIKMKNDYNNLIEIVQHGYKHSLNYQEIISGKLRKGEFGGKRTFIEQFEDINNGSLLMEKYFDDKWFKAFTFPYGARNDDSILALDKADFKVINGGYSSDLKHKFLYIMGRLLNKRILFKKRISYNLSIVPQTNLFEIDMNFGFIKNYIDENDNAILFSLNELIEKFKKFENEKTIGILLHHRYHNSLEKIKLVDDFLSYLVERKQFVFRTQEQIYKEFCR